MKKLSAALLCTTLLFAVSGCIPSETSDGPVSSDKPEIQADAPQNPRVYMDEIRGTVKDFTALPSAKSQIPTALTSHRQSLNAGKDFLPGLTSA